MIPEAAAEIQNQLAFVSAVLGGFSIALAIGLLQLPQDRSFTTWATGLAITSAVALLVATVAGTFGAIWLAERPGLGRTPDMPAPLLTAFRWAAQALVLGICLLLSSLGLSGWIRSRALGWTTSVVSAFAAILIFYFLIAVVDVI
jgi:hypothetical protein